MAFSIFLPLTSFPRSFVWSPSAGVRACGRSVGYGDELGWEVWRGPQERVSREQDVDELALVRVEAQRGGGGGAWRSANTAVASLSRRDVFLFPPILLYFAIQSTFSFYSAQE